jgi:hypothetical protein
MASVEQVSSLKRKCKDQTVDYLSNVEFKTSEDIEIVGSFDKMGLNSDLLRGIYSYGILHIYFLIYFHISLNIKDMKDHPQSNSEQ